MKAVRINSKASNFNGADMKVSHLSVNSIRRSKIPFSQMKHGKFARLYDRHEPVGRAMLDSSVRIREFKF